MALADYALGSAPRLLRLAHQLTGDPDRAVDVVVGALSHSSVRRMRVDHPSVELDEAVLVRVVRLALRDVAPASTTASALDRLSHRARTAVVLGLGIGWDPSGIAEAMRTSVRRVRADVHAALELHDQDVWHRLLADPVWSVPTPPDLVERCARSSGTRVRRERRALLAAAALLIAAGGVGDVIGRAATEPAPLPSATHVAGLLDWPVRGDLVRDTGLLRTTRRMWATAIGLPLAEVHVLWAGHVGVGRLVVLQALTHRGPAIAVVADHDVTFRQPRLHIDEIDLLPSTKVPFLAVPYDGNLNIPGLEPGPGSRVVQLLTAPDVTAVEQRRVLVDESLPLARPAYVFEPLADGLSEPWLDLSGQRPDTVVLVRRNQARTLIELLQEGMVPLATAPDVTAAPAGWTGLDNRIAVSTLADDALWWAQVCRAANVPVAPIWSSDSGASAGLRVEMYSCPGHDPVVVGVTGTGANFTWLRAAVDHRRGADALVLRVTSPQTLTALTLVLGPVTTGRVVIDGKPFAGRTAEFVGAGPIPVAAYDTHGRPMALLILTVGYPG